MEQQALLKKEQTEHQQALLKKEQAELQREVAPPYPFLAVVLICVQGASPHLVPCADTRLIAAFSA